MLKGLCYSQEMRRSGQACPEDPLSRLITNQSFYGRAIVRYKVIAIASHTFSPSFSHYRFREEHSDKKRKETP